MFLASYNLLMSKSCSLLSVQYIIILEITSVCRTVDKLWIYKVHVLVRDVRVVQADNI